MCSIGACVSVCMCATSQGAGARACVCAHAPVHAKSQLSPLHRCTKIYMKGDAREILVTCAIISSNFPVKNNIPIELLFCSDVFVTQKKFLQ